MKLEWFVYHKTVFLDPFQHRKLIPKFKRGNLLIHLLFGGRAKRIGLRLLNGKPIIQKSFVDLKLTLVLSGKSKSTIKLRLTCRLKSV